MAKSPADKKPAPRKPTNTKKPAAPAKRAAGTPTPATKRVPAAKKAPPKSARKPRAAAKKAEPQLGLTEKQQRFVDEYLVDLNATQAAIRAGYSADTAGSIGHENLQKPEIALAIAEARKAQQERTQITADRVVMELGLIAFADARELAEVKTGCCRHCWGEGFRFQRTLSEYNLDREDWLEKGKDPMLFEEKGGIGYDSLKLPHPECPECGGDGQARVVLKDTRRLSPQAQALYAGAKMGKYGVEVMFHSKMDAVEKLAKHLGIYEKDNEQKTDPLTSLLARIASGNNNGFKTVQDDPEAPARGSNAITPRQTPDDEDD
ncbi:terminase small subunit [Delftia acidovorans]|uniref:terminase small subunit n=1 Tax=Delftia acidovorans TaxID=80866 RepID=UPI00192A987A|nr:terminase small subunit [Delftia acidovorans]